MVERPRADGRWPVRGRRRRRRRRWAFPAVRVVAALVLAATSAGLIGGGGAGAQPAQAQPAQAQPAKPGWLPDKDPTGVSFSHPAAWAVKPGVTGGAVYVFVDPAGTAPFRRNVNIMLEKGPRPLTNASFLRISKVGITQAKGKILQQSPTRFGGTAGYRLVWRAKLNGQALEFLSIWTVRHGAAWLFTYTSDPPHFASAISEVDRLAATVKLPG